MFPGDTERERPVAVDNAESEELKPAAAAAATKKQQKNKKREMFLRPAFLPKDM